MGEYVTKIMGKQTLSRDGAEALYDFLTGVPDKGFTFRKQPEMEPVQAIAVVCYIERKLAVTPNGFTVFDDANSLYQWLQNQAYDPGEPYFLTKCQPRLSSKEAFAVIYYLQEKLGIIPGTYEQCSNCGGLYDSEQEGTVNDLGEPLCGECSHLG